MSTAHRIRFTWDPAKAASNTTKHRVTFGQAATIFSDPLSVTVLDARHSQHEERWFTLGMSSEGKLLAVSHTYSLTTAGIATIRIISARPATRHERRDYENDPI